MDFSYLCINVSGLFREGAAMLDWISMHDGRHQVQPLRSLYVEETFPIITITPGRFSAQLCLRGAMLTSWDFY